MRPELTTSATTTVARPIETVWKWLTDADLVERYFFGTRLEAEWKAGGRIYFRGTWDGKAYEDKGTVLEIDAPRLLRYDYWSNLSGKPDVPENYIVLAYELTDRNGATDVTIRQTGAESDEALEHSKSNWSMLLGELKKHAEGDR